MRWPLRRRSRPAVPVAASADVAPTRESRQELHPGRSRPRADWARLELLHPPSATPPLTFQGERFGRSVAGARPLLRAPLPRRSRAAPGGVVRDLAHVGAALLPDLGASAVPPVVHPPFGPIVHRKPAALAARSAGLTAADYVVELPPVRLRNLQPDDSTWLAPVTWTSHGGFVESDPATARSRTFRPRALPEADEPGAPEETPPADQAAPRFVPVAGPRRVSPPPDLVATVAGLTGIDVGDAVIDRSPSVTARAVEMGALAYTDGRTVHLPTELGALEDRGVRAVTAHELVHVAQQRRRGRDLPAEASHEGRVLEAEARAVERLVGGGAVVPAYLRTVDRTPVHTGDAPPGVLRRAEQLSDYNGPDLSELDLSVVEPGSPDDPFRWQQRPAEPAGVPNEQRWDYGARFEADNGNRLQHLRDTAYMDHLRQALAENAPDGAEPLDAATPQLLQQVARRLDTDMPYQFGAPAGVDPYPPLELPVRRSPARVARTAPATTVHDTGEAEEAAADRALAGLHGAALVHPTIDAGRAYGSGALAERFDRRFARERELRLEVMRAKAAAARDNGAESDHVVELDVDEIAEIRRLIDEQYPLRNVQAITYLPDTEHTRLSLDGLTVDPPGDASDRSRGRVPGRRGAMGPTDLPQTSITRIHRPGADADQPPAADAELEQRMSDRTALEILETLADHGPATGTVEPASQLSYGELVERYEQRMRLELEMRAQALGAKVELAVAAGAQVGDTVALIDTDLTAIHEALDRELPVPAPIQYLPTADHLQRRVTQADVGSRPAPHAVAAPPTSATAATDATTEAAATPDTAVGAPDAAAALAPAEPPAPAPAVTAPEPSARTSGITALASIVDHFLDGSPQAPDEMAHQVVQSLGEVELEMLARRLYGRIRRELRTELLIDRERAGALADIR
jgi:hypothetical protein